MWWCHKNLTWAFRIIDYSILLFDCLFMLRKQSPSHTSLLWGKFTGDQGSPAHKGPVIRKAYTCNAVSIYSTFGIDVASHIQAPYHHLHSNKIAKKLFRKVHLKMYSAKGCFLSGSQCDYMKNIKTKWAASCLKSRHSNNEMEHVCTMAAILIRPQWVYVKLLITQHHKVPKLQGPLARLVKVRWSHTISLMV